MPEISKIIDGVIWAITNFLLGGAVVMLIAALRLHDESEMRRPEIGNAFALLGILAVLIAIALHLMWGK